MSEILSGRVTDVVAREDVGQYIIPDAARYTLHYGEELAIVDPALDHWVRRVPSPIDMVADVIVGLAPASLQPPTAPTVIASDGTFDVGDDVVVEVEAALDRGVPAAGGEVLVYRFVDFDPHPRTVGDQA